MKPILKKVVLNYLRIKIKTKNRNVICVNQF